MSPKQKSVTITQAEKEQFLTCNAMPENETEGYIWFAVENTTGGVLYLFDDELQLAAEMARRAGLDGMAARLENGGSDALP